MDDLGGGVGGDGDEDDGSFAWSFAWSLAWSCGFLSGVGLVAVLLSCCAGWCCDAGLWDRLGLA